MRDLARLFWEYGIQGDPVQEVKPMIASLYDRDMFDEVPQVLEQVMRKYICSPEASWKTLCTGEKMPGKRM